MTDGERLDPLPIEAETRAPNVCCRLTREVLIVDLSVPEASACLRRRASARASCHLIYQQSPPSYVIGRYYIAIRAMLAR